MTTVAELKQRPCLRGGRSHWVSGLVAVVLTFAAGSPVAENADARWQEIRASLFGNRSIEDGATVLGLDTPYRAQDAAIVPVTIESKLDQTPAHFIKQLYLIIDNNPSPVAAVFHFPGTHDWDALSTRVRVNAYTDLRVIAETSDGKLYMTSNFVKAAGGCSAPPLKDPGAAAASLGKMKLKIPQSPKLGSPVLAQLLIKHPNSSGLQFDQISRQYIPPDFIRTIEVRYNDEVVFTVDSDISISEDPSIRFSFVPQEKGAMQVRVKDSKGRLFDHSFELSGANTTGDSG